ncbi:hypothetical protein PVAP13_1NG195900 [Panicum virgatum]|uniref:Calcineurin B-like protein n=1 Tax=Panicum virgatum TaxID=38727 RepID=A0A8T0WXJ7_PANVG|nr:hypothetical protein PVAP13_1NG195900 [Panicum virgatum]KAG2650346.1 hypothetical protein PVAP13_1NG195900 [Panicum virgatum]KAG2650347.1 hypothetical protein PVAP13_1NG195900 [Panicum virgatum]KAG2650349.1 hypothetical protein PVAP13_1NG195900 [Panicum virgatum]
MGCVSSKQLKRDKGYEDPNILAKETTFSVNEVEALYQLYKKISHSIIKDGLIHKEFQLALFRNSNKKNLFADRLKEMVLAILNESELILSDDAVEQIVDQTFKQADMNDDGKIDFEEWKAFASKNPALLKNMTLPYLKDITMAFPSFVLNSRVSDEEL